MNLQETIRRILREESNIKNIILRRVGYRLKQDFEYSLDFVSNLFIKNYKRSPYRLSETQFSKMVCFQMIDELNLMELMPDTYWFYDVNDLFLELFGDEISRRYNELKRY